MGKLLKSMYYCIRIKFHRATISQIINFGSVHDSKGMPFCIYVSWKYLLKSTNLKIQVIAHLSKKVPYIKIPTQYLYKILTWKFQEPIHTTTSSLSGNSTPSTTSACDADITQTHLPPFVPNTRMKTDVIQQTWVNEGQGQIWHPTQLNQTVDL
jgi:hypothetical protein